MHTCTKGCTRIYMNDHLILILRLYVFPRRDDQYIIDSKLMEILLPVIYPIYIFCLRFLDLHTSDIHIGTDLFQFLTNCLKHLLLVLILFQIEADISHAVIHIDLRQDVHEHLLLLSLGKRNLVFHFHTLDSQIHQTAADNILCFCRCFNSKFIPFHMLFHLFIHIRKLF